MPSMRQPKPLRMLGVTAVSELLIKLALRNREHDQLSIIKDVISPFIPPVMLQDVHLRVMHLLGSTYSSYASPDIISYLLHILLHPRMTEVDLSELSFIGNVELDSLDVVENALIQLLPSMTQLTYVDLSTHRFKITFPSCSDEILETLAMFCPHLVGLNLNFNNRVTGKGLHFLHPVGDHTGCAKLEKLFILDCNVKPEDVALLICSISNLKIIGYKELGTSLRMLKCRPKTYGLWNSNNQLKLTHVDNTMSGVQRCDGAVVEFLGEACPQVENLKIRIHDDDLERIQRLDQLKHLEVRFFTSTHHPVGFCTEMYLKNYGSLLVSFTIYCEILLSRALLAIAEGCTNLKKLFIHANVFVKSLALDACKNKLQKLEVL
ncbi:hypothetical protein SK128_021509 [Halocaridina rubra]|uniref:Uncharacterized protein n=1 Tax=Halocaridina rubra TaxID=373956 RepID=A0AAN8XD95_HALRR